MAQDKPTVLYVDDELMNLKLFEATFKKDYDLILTESPKEALEISQHGLQVKKSPRNLALGGLICITLVFPLSLLPGVLGVPLPGYLAILLLFIGKPSNFRLTALTTRLIYVIFLCSLHGAASA